ncbi:DNA-binding protein [Pseudomonas alliivorans]|uniref:DNA-binding protein n=1 Tax=Pseudomonas alliivorans TaxID=2810613 RepID=UPI001AE86B4B|nr:DNA-binding protein [Pseudomonas alliivorans]MBP0943235.1 DNA-binding protein [Pseudomonas alliivorans]MEE4881331.1 DNA-binding protein [Pseudomonas alliivorans]MEE4932755.1 DNA-binding protein [Pseudomonas alliivorans]MEE4938119.1 DNA-binding protein [Pseudomonas alliivorans]MEE4943176.1 DNA-binding protein [Pseudomonas alliivorans]
MARGGVNKALVLKARSALLARGENPSIDAVRIEMGNTGSKTTIHRYLKELETAHSPAPDINEELTELVANLARRLQEQAQERIDQLCVDHETRCRTLQDALLATQTKAEDLSDEIRQKDQTLERQATALLDLQETLINVRSENTRLTQVGSDLESRLTDKNEQIRSLEEKHLHARDALEHYRNSIREQREHEQQRHEGQVQQLQMELRQAQQSLSMRQEDITRLNRDNERLLAEARSTQRDLHAQKDLTDKASAQAAASIKQHQQGQTQCALLEEKVRSLQEDTVELKQNLKDTQQQNRVLELLLIKKEVALETLKTASEPPAKASSTRRKPTAP